MSVAFLLITQYYTEYAYRPVQAIAEASQTGPATNIIQGIAVGIEATVLPVFAIGISIVVSYYLGRSSGLVDDAGQPIGGLFGTAIATMGMLGTVGYVLAMDTFGPITDNAGGIIEMSQQPESVRAITDRLDAVGNTTKALTKGYAIGSAALAAFLLFSAYLDEVFNYTGQRVVVNIARPELFVAGLLGAMLVFWFSSLAIKAVGRAAYSVINEVRRQFKEKPGIMKGTDTPDYGRCVDIVTIGALKEMVVPGRAGGRVPDRGRAGLQDLRAWGRGGGGVPDGGDDRRYSHGDLLQHRRWCLGQRQEVHRDRRLRRQAVRYPQGERGRRYGRRSIQGHRRAVAARAREAVEHHHAGTGATLYLTRSGPWAS